MSIEIVRDFFAWCSVINMGLLLFWFLMFSLARGWVYKMHSKWYRLSESSFDAIHYGGMTAFKMAFFLFNLVPYFALRIIG